MEKRKAASSAGTLRPWREGLWRFALPSTERVVIGVTDRTCHLDELRQRLPGMSGLILAEQVHGASVAAASHPQPGDRPVPGCDGLTTRTAAMALAIRTADCLPIACWDPVRRAVGLVHAGWRGLAGWLPMRLVTFMRQVYHSRPPDLRIAIGPAIRACCYEVSDDFLPRFAPFMRREGGRWHYDLVASAVDQLTTVGVRSSRILDAGACTACDTARWHSFRREGESNLRLFSFAMIQSHE